MSSWIRCNSCFVSPSGDRKLAVTSCGHVICNSCYSKGKQGICLICNSRCQVSALSGKCSPEVKALFSDVSVVATKYCKEISKVLTFRAGHQNRQCTYYQKKTEKQKDTFVQMKQEMQHMSKKLKEQRAYITMLETSLQHHSAKPSMAQVTHNSHVPHGHKSVLQISSSSPQPIYRHSSMSNVTKSKEVSEMGLPRNPSALSRAPLFGASQTGHTYGNIPMRLSSQDSLAERVGLSASISTFPGSVEYSYSHTSRWQSPIFKPPSFGSSMSSLF